MMNTLEEYISAAKTELPKLKKRFISSVNFVRSFNGFSEYSEEKINDLFGNDFLSCAAMLSGADCEVTDSELEMFNTLFSEFGITADEKRKAAATEMAKKNFNAAYVPDVLKYITDGCIFSGHENNLSKDEIAASAAEKLNAAMKSFTLVLALLTVSDGEYEKEEADFYAVFEKTCAEYISKAIGREFTFCDDLAAIFTGVAGCINA